MFIQRKREVVVFRRSEVINRYGEREIEKIGHTYKEKVNIGVSAVHPSEV